MLTRHLPGLKTVVAASGAVTLSFFTLLALGSFPGTQTEPTQSARREEMVKTQNEARGIKDQAVLSALQKVPRHRLVPTVTIRGDPQRSR